jgi:large subunit ribosomal protein L12
MEYMHAAMLLHKAGKKIEEDGLKKVLTAAGVEVDDAKIKAVVAALDGVNIDEEIKNAATVATPVASEEAPKEDKKEAAAEKKKDEGAAAAGLGSLFG